VLPNVRSVKVGRVRIVAVTDSTAGSTSTDACSTRTSRSAQSRIDRRSAFSAERPGLPMQLLRSSKSEALHRGCDGRPPLVRNRADAGHRFRRIGDETRVQSPSNWCYAPKAALCLLKLMSAQTPSPATVETSTDTELAASSTNTTIRVWP
jgi:hypothetical protein